MPILLLDENKNDLKGYSFARIGFLYFANCRDWRAKVSNVNGGAPPSDRRPECVETTYLRRHIVTLEEELAEYGRKYGFTDRARRLFTKPAASGELK